MKNNFFVFRWVLTCILFTGPVRSQIFNVASGTNMTIQAGTTFRADSLTLIPSSDFVITNTTLSKSTTVIHTSINPYISHVYQFSNLTGAFSGSVQINYDDAERNGIPEAQLTLNMHYGTAWIYYPASIRDAVNNYVLSTGVVITAISELTLAHLSTPLPVNWLTFTATKQNQTALLRWSTTSEQNTRNFEVQHSTDGVNWSVIGWVPAAGNSTVTSYYRFVHVRPGKGINYYRIQENENDNRSRVSITRTLLFSDNDEPFIVVGNPVTTNRLTVQVNTTADLSFYTADGKLLWKENVMAGTKEFDVSRYAKGTYFLRAGFTTKKVVIQ